jgi:O-antigen/teichoic acid export membrane protein
VNRSFTATGTMRWRALVASVVAERVLAHNLIVAAGTVVAGGLGVAFQSVVSHRLIPADYGGVFAVVTLITLIGLPASGFTLLMARQTSHDLASGQHASSETLRRRGSRALIIVGAALAVTLVVASPLLAQLLNVQVQLLFAAAIGLPFGLALPLLMGAFQGEQRFLMFSVLAVGQAVLKLVGAFALGIVWGPAGMIAGISLASVVVYFVALGLLRNKGATSTVGGWLRPALAYLAVIVPSTLALAVLLSADVLIVKHYFPNRAAGEYSAVAAIGRAIFWGASGVAAVLFPKVIFRSAQGRSGSHLVGASLVLVAAGGLGALAVLSLSSAWLLTAFAGSAYTEAAIYLPWYAVGMTLLGGVAVLIATLQTRGTPGFLAILLPLTLLEPMALVAFHQNLTQVVQVIDVSMALILIGLGSLYMVQERTADVAEIAIPSISAKRAVAQLGVER